MKTTEDWKSGELNDGPASAGRFWSAKGVQSFGTQSEVTQNLYRTSHIHIDTLLTAWNHQPVDVDGLSQRPEVQNPGSVQTPRFCIFWLDSLSWITEGGTRGSEEAASSLYVPAHHLCPQKVRQRFRSSWTKYRPVVAGSSEGPTGTLEQN